MNRVGTQESNLQVEDDELASFFLRDGGGVKDLRSLESPLLIALVAVVLPGVNDPDNDLLGASLELG